MVSADPEETPRDVEEFRSRIGIVALPWAIDGRGEISRALGANALETTVILDRDGEVVFRDASATDYETLRRELEAVL